MWVLPFILLCHFVSLLSASPIGSIQDSTLSASLSTILSSGLSIKNRKLPPFRPDAPYRWQSDSDLPMCVNFLKFGKEIHVLDGNTLMYARRSQSQL